MDKHTDMTECEFADMLHAMRIYGGSFVQALGSALGCADSNNRARLLLAFPEYVTKYGPGSPFYAAIARAEGAV